MKEMTRICKQKQNGLVVIRNGVMQRIIPKSDHPDVIYEEDTNHFYLNGVGKQWVERRRCHGQGQVLGGNGKSRGCGNGLSPRYETR